MPEEERALETTGEETRAKHGICIFVHKERDHAKEVVGVVFEIGIVNDCKFRICVVKRRSEGAALAKVSLVAQE